MSEVQHMEGDQIISLQVQLQTLHTDMKQMREAYTALRNGVYGLAAIGLAFLVMVGVYKERVDTLQKEVSGLNESMTKIQIDIAMTSRAVPRPGSTWLTTPESKKLN